MHSIFFVFPIVRISSSRHYLVQMHGIQFVPLWCKQNNRLMHDAFTSSRKLGADSTCYRCMGYHWTILFSSYQISLTVEYGSLVSLWCRYFWFRPCSLPWHVHVLANSVVIMITHNVLLQYKNIYRPSSLYFHCSQKTAWVFDKQASLAYNIGNVGKTSWT